MIRAKTVDEYIQNQSSWAAELKRLRTIFLDLGLEETVKWGGPVYTFNNKNIVGLGGFKAFVSLWYYQGALLKDKQKLLVNAQEGVTKALRQMRFRSIKEIDDSIIKAYTAEAINNQKQGQVIKVDRRKPLTIPPELQASFKKTEKLKQAFDILSLAKRREFTE